MKGPPVLARAVERGLKPFRGERASQLVPQARLSGPMPWVIAIMVALTAIAAAAGLALDNLADRARGELAGGATVQLLEANPARRDVAANTLLRLLESDQAVESARLVPEDELKELIEPWLDLGEDTTATVPVPALIDVQLVSGSGDAAVAQLRERVRAAVPSARVDAQSSWLAPVFSALSSLQWMAIALVVLLALTSVAAVWLASRNALGTNRKTIEIVHLLGGTDKQIARIFQRSIAFDAVLGGTVGLILGLVAVVALGDRFAALESGMVAGGGLRLSDWILLAAIPFAGVAIAILTARITVLAALRRML
ncbi:cell division protein FtsX [Altererythrobacter sp. MF3-039]|uniref:cell division protein FtsX n=1 Tax=Altererythrobacter sp. MF3-039 TaxID=3252901 RepID=UPI00390C4A7B